MKYYILSLYLWIFGLISLLVLFPVFSIFWLLTVLIDKNLRLLHIITSYWGILYFNSGPFGKLKIEGVENLNREKKYIVVANHQSLVDIFVLYHLHFHFKFIAKKEIFNIPIVGWVLSMNKYIKIKRGDKKSIIKMLTDSEKALNDGNSILIFPEGTRSKNGKISSFKEGAFNLAKITKTDVLPVVINGTFNILPEKGNKTSQKKVVTLKIINEIAAQTFENLTSTALSKHVRNIMIDELAKIRSK